MKKYLLRRKKKIEARLAELRNLLKAGTETRSTEEVQAEVDELTEDLESVDEALNDIEASENEGSDNSDEDNEEDEDDDSADEGDKNKDDEKRSAKPPETRDGVTKEITKSLSTRTQVKANEMKTRNAFARYLAGQITDSEARMLGVDFNGGNVLVPDVLAKEIITYAQEENPLRRFGTTHRTKGKQGFPILIKKASANRVTAERTDTAIPETDIGFDEVYLNPTEVDAIATVSKKALAMSDYNVESIVIEELKKSYVEKEARWMFTDAGNTGSLSAKSVDLNPTLGALTDLYEKLVKMKNSVPANLRKKGKFLMNTAAFEQLELLRTTDGFPLLRTDAGIEGGIGGRLITFPYEVTEYAHTDDAVPMVYFGDLSYFHIQDVIGTMEITKLVEKYAEFNKLGYKIWHLHDGQLVYGPFESPVVKLDLTVTTV